MSCLERDLRIFQGATKGLILVVRRSDGTRVNLSSELSSSLDAIKMQVKASDGDDVALITLDLSSGITPRSPQSGADEGVADIEIPPSATTHVEDGGTWPDGVDNFGRFRWDVRLTTDSDQVFYIVPPSDFIIDQVVTS